MTAPDLQPPAAPETDVSARQWSILAEDGTRAFTSEDVALRVATGDHGYTLGVDRDPIVASFTRANPGDKWTPITAAALLADLDAARERVRVVEDERDQWRGVAIRRERLHDQIADATARAESAEAAHEALRAGVEALADEHEAVMDAILPMPNRDERESGRKTVRTLRVLAGGAR